MTLPASAEVLTQRGALASVNSGQIGSADIKLIAKKRATRGNQRRLARSKAILRTASVREGRPTGPWAVELTRQWQYVAVRRKPVDPKIRSGRKGGKGRQQSPSTTPIGLGGAQLFDRRRGGRAGRAGGGGGNA